MLFSNRQTGTRYLFLALPLVITLQETGTVLCKKFNEELDPKMILTSALTCLALNIYHEGRGESELGKKIIAQTTINRAKDDHTNVCSEVMKPGQFTWTRRYVVGRQLRPAGKPKEEDTWNDCQIIARKALNGSLDVPRKYRNVTSFHGGRGRPQWTRNLTPLGRVGGHVYYQPKAANK